MYSTGWVTITNSSTSEDYADGTLLWVDPSDFLTFVEVHLWVNAEGHTQVVEYVKVPRAPFYLRAACTRISLATSLGTNICEYACSNGDCCWNTTSPLGASCAIYQPYCNGYAKCTNLLDDGEEDGDDGIITLEEVSEACRNYDFENAPEENLCEIMCEPGTCCYDTTQVCEPEVVCEVFDPCWVLYVGNSTAEEKSP